ncbi:MAG: xanthine dehydrogenase molybdopterin binding subunit [Alteromonadaceae bacterium]|nr:xanthine dehydrogenase molybdopterin binding subunit [Alteromonadaceae bacterium]
MRKLIEKSEATLASGQVGKSNKHESAVRHVTGQARYVDDIPEPANLMHAAVGLSPVAKGEIITIELEAVKRATGVKDVLVATDVPGHIDIAPVFDGDPVLAHKRVLFHNQPYFAVLASSTQGARHAAKLGYIEVLQESPDLDVSTAHEKSNFVRPTHTMRQGNFENSITTSDIVVEGDVSIGGQEHMYLEGQVAMAVPEEEDRMLVYTSSQHPSEVQKLVAEVLNVPLHKVTVDMRRMGGGFGGKETQAAQWACIAALLASRNRVPVKLRVPRMQDMQTTGKRHPFQNSFRIGVDSSGVINATKATINGLCGHSADLSEAIVDRAMFHCDNAYYLANADITGYRCRTDTVSHTAFRGFGGPQGMVLAEAMMDAIARELGEDPLTIRKRNLYQHSTRNTTQYGMKVEHNVLPDLIEKLEASSEYWKRREQISHFNQSNPILKKGLALTPVKFGISFTAKHLNQAGALVHIYTDGSIQVNHGGTEMGQGLHTKIQQIAAHEFGLGTEMIEVTSTRTDKVPNTSPTAASSGTNINGKAVQNACITLKNRLSQFWAQTINVSPDNVIFKNGCLVANESSIEFAEVVQQAYMNRVSLSTTGFYKTPKIHYDRNTGNGRPFFYFANGASVSEVTIDTLTGEYSVDRVDILHDVGTSLNPAIDIGQIEGGFIQGMGWMTTEELLWDDNGKLLSNNPATYKIPAIGDTPNVFNVALYPQANPEDSIYHSKAVGEPPLMLALSVWCALKDAVSSTADYRIDPDLDPPATPEKVLRAVQAMSKSQKANT